MAFAGIIATLASLIVLQYWTATANILSPIIDDVCKSVYCGKGTCKPSSNSTFLFVCECEPGWKQTRPAHDDDLKFLPCVIPNCTLDYSCMEAGPPAPDKENRANMSIFDPCYWTDCGGGTCNKTSAFTHACDCRQGFANLLNISAFPCFSECALGMDCSGLGIKTNKSTSPTASLTDNSTNQASSIRQGNIIWLTTILMISAPVIVWN